MINLKRKFKYSIFAIILITVMITTHKSKAQIPDTAQSYTLVFHDEFNDSINTDLWKSNTHWGNLRYVLTCPPNSDTIWRQQYYTNNFENFEKTDSTIKFVVKKPTAPGYWGKTWGWPYNGQDTCGDCHCQRCNIYQEYWDYYKYTSARLFSRMQFRYGYFEIRLKLPDPPSSPATYKGISANFWLYEADKPHNVAWSELDGFEINCRNNQLTNNIHFGDTIQVSNNTVPNDGFIYPSNLVFNNNFKTLSFDWSADSVIFYLDGIRIRSTAFAADTMIAMPIYFDLGVGYNQFCESVDTSNTIIPYRMEVDYVRVYQRKLDLQTNKSYCGNVNNHDFKVYKSISVDGSSCSDVVTNKTSFPMEATDYIILDVGFEASATSNLLLNIIKSMVGQDYSPEIHEGKSLVPPPQSWFERIKFHY